MQSLSKLACISNSIIYMMLFLKNVNVIPD